MRFVPKALLLAGVAGLTSISLLANAQDTPPPPGPGPQPGTPAEPPAAPAPANQFTGKVGLWSEYEYRGISQSSQNPALQLNLDYVHNPSGFYIGTFLSNIKWLQDTAAAGGFSSNARVEWDIYGGWRHEIYKDTTLDVGYLRYEYPSSGAFNPKPNTDEVYAGITWQWLNLKYSYSFNNTFAVPNSKGSDYIEANVAYPMPGFEKLTLTGTLAHQRYKGTQASGFSNGDLSYTVWKAGASYDFGHGINAGAYWKGTDATSALYTVNGKDWSKDRLVAFVTYSF
jgi:uncharacterized protein (TIGR02001 family)